jgi:5'-3' exonuclease
VRGWGEKTAAATLSRYPRLEDIPKDWREWDVSITGARRLCASLAASWDDALLFRTLATLRLDAPVFDTVEDLRWMGPASGFEACCQVMGSPDLFRRAASLTTAVR